MNILYSIIAFVIAVILVIQQIRVWRYRVFLSPGFYFGFLWSLGFLGVTILHPVGLLIETYPQYIDELNILAGFACLCFLLWTRFGRNNIKERRIVVYFPTMTFKILCVILIAAALNELMRVNVGLTNMGAARQMVHDIVSTRSTITNYAILTSKILSFLAGYKIVSNMVKNIRISIIDYIFLFMPLVANLFLSIVVGGRVDFVYSTIYYGIGAAFSLPAMYKIKRKVFGTIVVGLLVIILFINAVSSQRHANSSGFASETENYIKARSPIFGAFFGPINYMSSTYVGYQYRRVDDVDPDYLGYGLYTFNGFINWTFPFAGLFGMKDASIAKELDIYYNNIATYDFVRDYYDVTNSGFLPMVKDYGFPGALVCIFFLTLLSHIIFVRIQRRGIIFHCYQLFFFILFLECWMKMNYMGELSKNVLVTLYPLLIIDGLDLLLSETNKMHKLRKIKYLR